MLTATITAIVGIAIVILTIWWVTRGLPESEEEEIRKGKKRTQELMATSEGRQWLAEKVGGTFEDLRKGDDKGTSFIACLTCDGYGKLGHHSKIIKGAKVEFTSDEICKACGGTGIEGGLDYENIACPTCEGKGALLEGDNVVGPKCPTCQGTKVVQRDRVEKGEK